MNRPILATDHRRSIPARGTQAMEHKKRRFRHAWSISETAFSLMTRKEIHKEDIIVLGRPGSDLLSQGLSHSTIGAEEF
ncbi:hypothetical protein, partial [Nitrobacter sp. 62-13]|uniref:hypothetical protein n=1 Tax=Nitrobacter sp. 62-13 TaxID=1895797 RepID=UPI0025F0AE01